MRKPHERVFITSTSLPEEFKEETNLSAVCYQLLGPIVDADMLRILEDTFVWPDEVGEVQVTGYLPDAGYRVLNHSGALCHPELYVFMRPLACTFTELCLGEESIACLPENDYLKDLVMRTYISNLLDDLHFFAEQRLPNRKLRITGSYLDRRSGRFLPCQPLERKLTPRFGDLSFAVTQSEIRSYWPT